LCFILGPKKPLLIDAVLEAEGGAGRGGSNTQHNEKSFNFALLSCNRRTRFGKHRQAVCGKHLVEIPLERLIVRLAIATVNVINAQWQTLARTAPSVTQHQAPVIVQQVDVPVLIQVLVPRIMPFT
jgi:hypothetical protein